MSFTTGERVRYRPKKGKEREGEVMPGFVDTTTHVKVKLDGDPFPVDLPLSQVSACKNVPNGVHSDQKSSTVEAKKSKTKKRERKNMTAATLPSAKELRKKAQALGVEGWEDMGREEMAKAIAKAEGGGESSKPEKQKKGKKGKKGKKNKPAAETTKPKVPAPAKAPAKKAAAPAKKTTAKKAAPAKAAAKKAAPKAKASKPEVDPNSDEGMGLTFASGKTPKALPDEGVNPFRKSSNLFRVAALLLKGGKRETLATKLASQVDLHPYHKDEIDLDDYDKRLLLGAQTMRDQFGYGIQRKGRGKEGSILVFRPGGPKDPRKNGGKAKPAAKKATKAPAKKAAAKK